jgi:hypothetical protein
MRRKRRQGNMIPQNSNNNIIVDLVESKGDESSVADLRRMMTRMFNELKENMQKQLNEYQENTDKENLKKTQKQLNKLKENFNKLLNETK